MTTAQLIIGIIMILISLIIIAVVLIQQGRRSGLGAISGGADTFLSKSKARTVDAVLGRWTKYIALAFFILAIIANVIAIVGTK